MAVLTHNILLPMTEDTVRSLHVGDMVQLSGHLFTGRDAVHKYLYDNNPSPVDLSGGVIYHCGPVVIQENGQWVVKAAGPTTSAREEPYQSKIIEQFGIRAVIGKGGMGEKTRDACKRFGCVYLHAVGGAAQVLAEHITKVNNVYLMEKFGAPEAIWDLQIQDFPALVTIDAHGHSLHEEVAANSQHILQTLI